MSDSSDAHAHAHSAASVNDPHACSRLRTAAHIQWRERTHIRVILLAVRFGFGFRGIPGMLLSTPALVALKVAAQLQPQGCVLRDSLAPIGQWHPHPFHGAKTAPAKEGDDSRLKQT